MRTFLVLLASITAYVSVSLLSAAAEEAAPETACSFLAKADIERVTGRVVLSGPTALQLPDGAGILCDSNVARAMIFSGLDAEAHWEDLLKGYGRISETRNPVPELGERAYAIYPMPRNEQEYPTAIVVVPSQGRVVVVSVRAA